MNLKDDAIEKMSLLFNLAIKDLKQDLSHFKTWHENSRLHESNLTFHVGRLLKNSGILFFPEVPIDRNKDESGKGKAFDAIAWEPHSRTGLLIESKYLFSGSIASLVGDLKRMHFEKPLDRFQLLEGHEFQTGLILVHSYQASIQEWWVSDLKEGEVPKGKKDHLIWNKLGHILRQGTKGGGPITDPDANGNCFWMMWCLFPLKSLEPLFSENTSQSESSTEPVLT